MKILKKKLKWGILLFIGVIIIIMVGGLIYFKNPTTQSSLSNIKSNILNAFFEEAAINPYHPNPELDYFSVTLDNGLKISYRGYAVTYQPVFIMENGQQYKWFDIPSSIEKDLWKTCSKRNTCKYGADFSNVPDSIKNNLKFVVLHRTNATKTIIVCDEWLEEECIESHTEIVLMTVSDIAGRIKIQGGSVILNDKVTISHSDILRNYNIPIINKSDIVIGGLDNNWTVCDEWNETSMECISSHVEFNWKDNGDGTWNISFDPTITIDEEDVVSDSLLINVTAETGDRNFTHLNMSNSHPFNETGGYWSFDGDLADTLTTTHYDFTEGNIDGTGIGHANVSSVNCLSGFGNCLQMDGAGDSVNLGTVLTDSEPFTISAWCYIDDHGDDGVIMAKRGQNDDGRWWDFHYIDVGANVDLLRFQVDTDENTFTVKSDDGVFSMGEWTYIVLTWNGGLDASEDAKMYVNGIEVSYQTQTDGTGTHLSDVNEELEIGSLLVGGGTRNFKGQMDEVMFFNTTLTTQQILDIYNNQSARFVVEGEQSYDNSSQTIPISSGNNEVNVTTTLENNFGSKVNLSVGYYDGSWTLTAPQTITSGINYTYTISGTSTNLTLNYTLIAGNSTDPFYSPLIKGDIILDYYSVAPADANPVSILKEPLDNNSTPQGVVTFEVNATDDSNLLNVTLYIWNKTSSALITTNETNWTGTSNSTTFTYNFTLDDDYEWNALVYDNASQLDWADANFTLTIVPIDTCTCAGLNQDWEIDMSDYCNITTDCNLGTGTLNWTGTGETKCNATINTTDLGDPNSTGILYIQDSCLINIFSILWVLII